jgi:hypothetical protein
MTCCSTIASVKSALGGIVLQKTADHQHALSERASTHAAPSRSSSAHPRRARARHHCAMSAAGNNALDEDPVFQAIAASVDTAADASDEEASADESSISEDADAEMMSASQRALDELEEGRERAGADVTRDQPVSGRQGAMLSRVHFDPTGPPALGLLHPRGTLAAFAASRLSREPQPRHGLIARRRAGPPHRNFKPTNRRATSPSSARRCAGALELVWPTAPQQSSQGRLQFWHSGISPA